MKNKDALQTVKEIKTLMERSSKFLSFSGLSVILIGFYALAGAFFANRILQKDVSEYDLGKNFMVVRFALIAAAVLLASVVTILVLSYRKSVKSGQPFFNRVALRTFINLSLPLASGGIFCAAMVFHGYYGIISSAMLLFYGLSLINVSKFTYGSIFWLGLSELLLGLACAFFIGNELLFWAFGFGILHVVYGIYFYYFVERKER